MAVPKLIAEVDSLFCGQVVERWPDRASSAIHKTLVRGKQSLTWTGFALDSQADLAVHGGLDKAVHHYAADHYDAWISEDQMPAGTVPAAFGENISTLGLTEENVCIGDVFKLGTARVQISQGRQPCWKLNRHTQNDMMAFLFQQTGRTGWYYRVLEQGEVAEGDDIQLIDRPNEAWSVKTVTQARLTRRVSVEDAVTLSQIPELAEGWRSAFAKFAVGKRDEDTAARLKG